MSNKTNNLENFQVRIDGELQTDPPVIQALQAARSIGLGTLELLAAATAPIAATLAEMATNVQLDYHDARHGTHLRAEYFTRKHELATAAVREQFEL